MSEIINFFLANRLKDFVAFDFVHLNSIFIQLNTGSCFPKHRPFHDTFILLRLLAAYARLKSILIIFEVLQFLFVIPVFRPKINWLLKLIDHCLPTEGGFPLNFFEVKTKKYYNY